MPIQQNGRALQRWHLSREDTQPSLAQIMALGQSSRGGCQHNSSEVKAVAPRVTPSLHNYRGVKPGQVWKEGNESIVSEIASQDQMSPCMNLCMYL
ncbi:hypothetical protein DV515_00006520 [Chloebia gouldiae]|uniref:Uncharacterized protein n=1 Tax=Chloebia gouldiae TaxID=44316 RepID=A0A3L8SKZ4_CHLGU|nr:hypothetical protein DV515_00006520 [Chloebia gouldiae]